MIKSLIMILLFLLPSLALCEPKKWLIFVAIDSKEQSHEFLDEIETLRKSLSNSRLLEVIQQARASEIFSKIHQPDVEAVFFVGHGRTSRNFGNFALQGRIADFDNNDLSYVFPAVSDSALWLGIISCEGRKRIEEKSNSFDFSKAEVLNSSIPRAHGKTAISDKIIKNNRLLRKQSGLVIDSPISFVTAEDGLKNSLRLMKNYFSLLRSKTRSCFYEQSAFWHLEFSRSSNRGDLKTGALLLELNNRPVAVFDTSKEYQSQRFQIPSAWIDTNEPLRLQIRNLRDQPLPIGQIKIKLISSDARSTEIFSLADSPNISGRNVARKIEIPVHDIFRSQSELAIQTLKKKCSN